MEGKRRRGNGLMAALLVAVQLIAFVALPLVHSPAADAARPAFALPGTGGDSHNESACSVCRLTHLRFAGVRPVSAFQPFESQRADGVVAPRSYRAAAVRVVAASPRAPPRNA